MKRLISALAAVFVMTLCLTPALGAEPEQHVFDNADIFTDAEEAELEKRIEQFQADVQADAVILTEQDGSVNDPELRAQDFYDANGFGLGSNRSGVILYINMETRDVVACASGETKYVLLNTDLDTVIDAGYDELADGEYADSMHAMLGKATSVIKRHEVSGEYEMDSTPVPTQRRMTSRLEAIPLSFLWRQWLREAPAPSWSMYSWQSGTAPLSGTRFTMSGTILPWI